MAIGFKQVGPLLVLVSPCFRENVNVTCEIVSFLCSLDNFLLKTVNVFILEIKFQNGAHLKKGLFLSYFSYFLVTREMTPKFLLHKSHLHPYMYFVHPITLLPSHFCEKNVNLSCMICLWCDTWC